MDTSKIIKGVVNSGRYTVTAPIIKEDYGLYLQIEGVELPQTYEVDFSNSEHSGTSVTMIGNSDGVLIPHQFIDTGKDIFAFLYHVGENFGRTVYKFRIPNKVRPDRTNEEPTPEEQSVIDQAIGALNDAVAQTAQDVIDADASAQSASADAERAEEARTDAQNYATQAEQARDDAQTYANNASASATASAQSASQSAQIKSDVEGMVDDAQGYAQASERSASASANSATTAQGFAQSASASAQSASGYASNAQTSANTASNKASEASTSAQTASNKASEASQSASQALTYKTDAETAKTASQTAQGLAESARDSAIQAKESAESAKADAESARDEAQTIVDGISGALDDKAPVITDTASGAVASFSDGADDLPLKSFVVDINPVQDLHGQDAPYPAGGGKNKFDKTATNTENGYGAAQYIGITGKLTGSANYNVSEYISVSAETVYTLNPTTGSNPSVVFYDSNKQYISGVDYSSVTAFTFTTPANAAYLRASIPIANVDIFQLELGSTATAWSPYENICPISGWTSVDVNQRGKNLVSAIPQNVVRHNGNPTIICDEDNTVTIKAQQVAAYDACFYVMTITESMVGLSVTVSAKEFKQGCPRITKFPHGNYSITPTDVTNSNIHVRTITQDDVGYDFAVRVYNDSGADLTFEQLQLELGSTATPYEPYQGRSITIDLGQTVYGGKLDVLSGELVVDRAMVDLNTLNWYNAGTATSGINRFGYSVESLDIKLSSANNVRANMICDRYATETADGTYLKRQGIAINASNKRIFVFDPLYNDVADFRASFDHLYLCYELATPITIQLTPHQVNSLLGVNNIWADSGDTEVEYRADTKAYIAKKIAEAIASLT